MIRRSFSAFSFNLLNRLIPCIPEEKLDEEYEYWRTFYATKVKKIMKANTKKADTITSTRSIFI